MEKKKLGVYLAEAGNLPLVMRMKQHHGQTAMVKRIRTE